ncbi:MAG: alpha/beta hydrolase-fold protein [Planctomycetota bacterium]
MGMVLDVRPGPGAGWCGRVLALALLAVACVAPTGLRDVRAEDEPAPREEKILGPSLRDQAIEALTARRLDDARDLYVRWLEADPRDGTSWYNLACVHALAGRVDDALDALENAFRTGFDDVEHAQEDPDLATLRTTARFGRAVAQGIANKVAEHVGGLQRHALATETVGTYVVLLPRDYATSDRRYPVVVILHGSGSTEIGHGRVADALGRDGVIYVAPRALHPHLDVIGQSGKPGWTVWPPERDDAEEAPDPMVQHTDWVLRCVDDVGRRYRAKTDRVAVWGHSQGAASANILAARHPERVQTFFAYAGYYPDVWFPHETLVTWKMKGVHVELAHGLSDTVVPPEGTKVMKRRLGEAGVSHAVHLVDARHRLTPEVRELSRTWVDRHVREPEVARPAVGR